MHDIFVTHDWRDNPDRDRALALLDEVFGLYWRNYGSPWYDPAIQLGSAEGMALVREQLEGQLAPSKVAIFVPSIYLGSQRGRNWVGLSIEIARRLNIPIIGMAANGDPPPEATVAGMADRWVDWNGPQLLNAIDLAITGCK